MPKAPHVVVTGGGRGIGAATARLFKDQGYRVTLMARSRNQIETLADEIGAYAVRVDVGDPASVEAAFMAAGPVDVLVNNAGMSPKTPFKERLGCLNGDLNAWQKVFDLNFLVPLRLSRGFASALHKGEGSIVNITSIAGHKIHPFAGSAYSISKAALSALTREMANEFAALGVRVNAVAPGEIETEMIQPEYEALIPRIPLDKMGSPTDVAGAIHYLCSDDARYVTGTEIWVTGGQHMF